MARVPYVDVVPVDEILTAWSIFRSGDMETRKPEFGACLFSTLAYAESQGFKSFFGVEGRQASVAPVCPSAAALEAVQGLHDCADEIMRPTFSATSEAGIALPKEAVDAILELIKVFLAKLIEMWVGPVGGDPV